MGHLLVTNDFPPKIGGIQSYIWELWRRLPTRDVTVLTTPYKGDQAFDADQSFRVVRTKQKWLLPTPSLRRQINQLAEEVAADFIVIDPAFPLGVIGPHLNRPYVVIGHGAEYTIPMRMPVTRQLIKRVSRNAIGMVASGGWVERSMHASAGRQADVPCVNVPPGVDTGRFVVASLEERARARQQLGVSMSSDVVVGVSRLVPRKGFDRLIRASSILARENPDFRVLIAGGGRMRRRLERLIARLNAPVTLLGRVSDEGLTTLYAAADVFCMPCHDRWFGLEQEGFGIVFVEAAAAGVPSVAGASGGSQDAVVEGVTGYVLGREVAVSEVVFALRRLIDDRDERIAMGERARRRAVNDLDYEVLAATLVDFLQKMKETAGRRRFVASLETQSQDVRKLA